MRARIQSKLTLGFHVDHQAREIFEKGRGRATRGKSNGSTVEKVFCRYGTFFRTYTDRRCAYNTMHCR